MIFASSQNHIKELSGGFRRLSFLIDDVLRFVCEVLGYLVAKPPSYAQRSEVDFFIVRHQADLAVRDLARMLTHRVSLLCGRPCHFSPKKCSGPP